MPDEGTPVDQGKDAAVEESTPARTRVRSAPKQKDVLAPRGSGKPGVMRDGVRYLDVAEMERREAKQRAAEEQAAEKGD